LNEQPTQLGPYSSKAKKDENIKAVLLKPAFSKAFIMFLLALNFTFMRLMPAVKQNTQERNHVE